ncbi:hypothetical protein F1645_11205 [Novacetimonas hansenii]|uniref:Uncharacterized protein n=2 Tax=Novacetimonas hansenii TaxID=436 RepID=A0ABQ0SGU3_NOVHA|nr:hypothetical protein [Novacetimonas hansenii]EFG86017.1 hypothetical protein GXY_00499 [Novacetimonas hansenii ATCC 23769]WEQ58176.1 hypothetical protein LV563_09855 [Novacetimonas hansenii]CUW48691.1 hypothetical protein ATCC53582_02835 [Novacetimonas hansenii]GAN85368.1 hypothetical protein Gaha_0391_013 [Novacetimonas hansenii JCM 7643]GBQ55238.1 hypothetical protein AA0243_0850 [Novacetimonas hansenii NRIC 0243]
MTRYRRFLGSELPNAVGRNEKGSLRVADGQEGHLSFGPYITLEAGDYVAGIYMRRVGPAKPANITIDVVTDPGEIEVAHLNIPHREILDKVAGIVAVPFSLYGEASNLQIRVFVPAGIMIEIEELVIIPMRARRWTA